MLLCRYTWCVADLVNVSSYLNFFTRDKIHQLGLVLGLHAVPTLDNIRYSTTFLSDMLTAWLQGKDDVNSKGGHTWTALVNALRHTSVTQNEIADKIEIEYTKHITIV